MQYKFFRIPASGDAAAEEEMNRFLRGHRVLTTNKEFVADGNASFWCFAVEYLDGAAPLTSSGTGKFSRQKRDYREILSEEEFARFRVLRECRKTLAESDAVPAYAVFLDEHLAEISKMPEPTLSNLKKINGVGEKKIEKYGEALLNLFSEKQNEAHGQFGGENR